MIVAGIDCGTNSIRLLIAETDGEGGLRELDRRTTIVRLGQGVDKTGRFAEEALERTFAAVDEYAAALREHEVAGIRFGATSATRDAENRDVFLDGVRDRLGITPEVIAGEEEARLSFTGATVGSVDDARTLVVDLGGGSTEFVVGRPGPGAAAIEGAISTDMGCVRFTERFVSGDPVTDVDVEALRAGVAAHLDEADRAVGLEGIERVIGVAGTITSVMAEALGLDAYRREAIHGASLPIEDVRAAAVRLARAPLAERADRPFMHPGRVDVIVAGALIWDAVLGRLERLNPGLRAVSASETDILDGLAFSAAQRAGEGA
ncbi:Ppx/GppA phosphatase family protein [Falsarthrobacter nasiphocae]|uniref:Exopolyphosphatase/guanosine-5'-triphosphate, 3'-diphosphate pyrophosphatase n=1 Tax=Falsarthrobacter nasiphocae TaxID=189863 RepID=A0AAE4C5M6_9MICC|nr:Ppx/GppA phosphatase family protein [Falsarthrobacter nasiphocae]MDR6891653.1 exopolyphosphatase/guanosine-5'-triphosphate,3'-diphosphate pyrophosphatase [Falsarthrobacter nasiphocae]